MQLNSRNDAAYWAKVPGLSGMYRLVKFNGKYNIMKFEIFFKINSFLTPFAVPTYC